MKCLILLQCLIGAIFAQGVTYTNEIATTKPTEDKSQCASEVIEWCKNRDYTNFTGVSVVSSSYFDGSRRNSIYCIQDSTGADCSNNRDPWFTCYTNKTLTYRGKPLTQENAGAEDQDICALRDQLSKMFTFEQKDFIKGMREFQKEMAEFRKSMSRIFRTGFPFFDNDDDDDEKESDSSSREFEYI